VVFNLVRVPWGSFAISLGAAKASDTNIHSNFYSLYFVYGTTFCRSQNNRITWQNDSLLFHSKVF